MLELHPDSHTDHGLSAAQLAWLVAQFADRDAFFIASVTLPEELGTVPCGLYGPAVGDPAVPDAEVRHAPRPGRAHPSRLVERPRRPTRTVTVIAGPHAGRPCVLYTAFGGPATPREPGDPDCTDVAGSAAFWAAHALAADPDCTDVAGSAAFWAAHALAADPACGS